MQKIIARFLVAVLTLQTGCASIVGGKHQSVHVETNPPGASIKTFREDASGISPTDFVLKRKREHQLIIEKAGYKTKKVFVENEIRGWFWMNMLSWGIIGILVDLATGAAYKLEPEDVVVTLEKE